MSLSNPRKTVAPGRIGCAGTAEVTLSFDAAAELAGNPADIVLIMDRSYSMDARRMAFARRAARNLIRTVAEASAPAGSTVFGSGTRMGMVSFSSQATRDVPLTDRIEPMYNAVTALSGTGNTNHRAAFEAAEALLGQRVANRQAVILFTDGITNEGGDAAPVTDRMKAAGVEIYCIGLLDDARSLEAWASLPLGDHIACTCDQARLEEIFQTIAARVVEPGARNIRILEEVSPDFQITAIRPGAPGNARITAAGEILWTLDAAGLTLEPQTLSLTFEIQHVGGTDGLKAVNQSLLYCDREGHRPEFPSPVIQVVCGGGPLYPEPCPNPTVFTVPGCQDAVRVQLDSTRLLSLGRILQLDVTLRSVCPGKRVAVSVVLTETDAGGVRHPRGVKHLLVPAQEGTGCRDIELLCIPFSLPEELNQDGGSLCGSRSFEAQVIANYVDTDFTCCQQEAAPLFREPPCGCV